MPPRDRDPDDGEAGGVHFVVGETQSGPDEELAQPDERDPGQRRLRVQLGIGALVLVVSLLVVRVGTGTGDSTPLADPSSATSTSLSPLPSIPPPTGPQTAPPLPVNGRVAVLPAVPRVPRRTGRNPRRCPGLRCVSIGRALPGSVRAAIQTAFPESTVENAETIVLRDHNRTLWYREVEARVGSEFLVLHVQAPARGDVSRGGYRRSDGRVTSYDESRLATWHVDVSVTDTTGGRADLNRVISLAGDDRLLVT